MLSKLIADVISLHIYFYLISLLRLPRKTEISNIAGMIYSLQRFTPFVILSVVRIPLALDHVKLC